MIFLSFYQTKGKLPMDKNHWIIEIEMTKQRTLFFSILSRTEIIACFEKHRNDFLGVIHKLH